MPSTFSPNLQLELQATGENASSWGTKANADFSQIDLSAGGNLSISVAGNSNVTLTTSQAQAFNHTLTGALTGNIQYAFIAGAGRFVVIDNQTTGNFTVTVLASGGAGVVAPQGLRSLIYLNPGSNAAQMLFNYISSLSPTQITFTGNAVSAAAWTTNGIRAKLTGATYTDTTSSGTVAEICVDAFKAATVAASSATTATDLVGTRFENPVAGTNVTGTNVWAVKADSLKVGGNFQLGSGSAISTLTQFQTWTPTDQSGASLTFTVNDARYARIGNIVIVTFDIVYPTTASGAAAKISLPVAPGAGAISSGAILTSSNSGYSMIAYLNGTAGAFFNVQNAEAAGAQSNATLSGKEIIGTLIYST